MTGTYPPSRVMIACALILPRQSRLSGVATRGPAIPCITKRYRHPSAGRLDIDYIKLATAGNDQQHLIVFLPADPVTARKPHHLY